LFASAGECWQGWLSDQLLLDDYRVVHSLGYSRN